MDTTYKIAKFNDKETVMNKLTDSINVHPSVGDGSPCCYFVALAF